MQKNISLKKYFFLIAIFCFIFLITLKFNCADWDLWARMAVGKLFFAHNLMPLHDPFSYTQQKPLWVDHEWGSGVIFYYLSAQFGKWGLIALKFFIILFTFFFVYKTNELRSDNNDEYRIIYYALFFFGLMAAYENIIRSQVFTYLFFAMWIYLLDLIKKGNNKLIWLFPITMLFWANIHGGFLVGLCITFIYGIGEFLNKREYLKYFQITGLSAIVTLINPYGWKYWPFLFSAITMDRTLIKEWAPLNIFHYQFRFVGFEIFAVFVLISYIYLIKNRLKEVNWAEVLILVATFYMGMKHKRHVIFFVIAAASYIYFYLYPALSWATRGLWSKFLSHIPPKLTSIGYFSRDVVVYGLIFFMTFCFNIFHKKEVLVSDRQYPTKAVEFIKENNLNGNLLTFFNWGSYALWKLYPQMKVSIDGRYEEVYTDATVNDNVNFQYTINNWNSVLNKYHNDAILIQNNKDTSDLQKNLHKLSNWKIVYRDKTALVYVPTSSSRKKWKKVNPNFNATKEIFISGYDKSAKSMD